MLYLSKNGVAAGSRGIFLGEIFIPVSEGISSAGGRGGVLCVKGSKPPEDGLIFHFSGESSSAETGQRPVSETGGIEYAQKVDGIPCADFASDGGLSFSGIGLTGTFHGTISVWVRYTEALETVPVAVVGWGLTSGTSPATSRPGDNEVGFFAMNSGSENTMFGKTGCYPDGSSTSFAFEFSMEQNRWYHFLMSVSDGKADYFVDGVRAGSKKMEGVEIESSPFVVNSFIGSAHDAHNACSIAGIRIYNRVLSDAERNILDREFQAGKFFIPLKETAGIPVGTTGILLNGTENPDASSSVEKLFLPVFEPIPDTRTILEKISSIVETNSGIAYTARVSEFGNLSGSFKWNSGVLAPNGKIYGIPYSSTTVLEIDPTTNTSFTFGSLSGSSDKWNGGVLGPNGKIYAIPRESETVLEINPVTRIVKTFGHVEKPSSGIAYIGGVLAPNGKIYAIPYNAGTILKIDPASQSVSTFGTLSGLEKWSGGVLAPNGKIYGIPYGSSSVLEIDPETDSISTFGSLSGSSKWDGGVLAPNGKIYGIPRTSSSVLEIDPLTGTVSTFGNISLSGAKWSGGVLAPNGKIYGIPRDSRMILEIDPETRTVSTFQTLSSSGNKWRGGTLAPNGKIYAIPFNASKILEISFDWSGQPFTTEICLSSSLNKF